MDLVNLKTMILRQNQIEDLQDGSFFGLINLQSLYVYLYLYDIIYKTDNIIKLFL